MTTDPSGGDRGAAPVLASGPGFRPRPGWLGLAALLVAAGPVPMTPSRDQLPGLSAADPRVAIDVRGPPWSALLKLQVPGSARCSAVLVRPDLAATAAHCLFIRRAGHFAPPGSVHLLAGYRDGSWTGETTALSYRVAPGFDPLHSDATRGADVAVLTLRTRLPGTALALVGAVPGQPAELGGFSQDRSETAMADRGCRVIGAGRDEAGRPLLLHDCAATAGASGGALLVAGPGGTAALAGIESGGFAGQAGGVAAPAASLQALVGP